MPENDPIQSALARLEAGQAKLETSVAKLDSEQTRLREHLNTKLDNILDGMKAMREDTDATRGHVLVGLQENLTLSQRRTKLEEEMRRRG